MDLKVSEDGAYEKRTEHNGTENKKSNHVNRLKDGKSLSAYGALPSSPIPLPNCSLSASSERDLYYMYVAIPFELLYSVYLFL